MQQEIHDLVVIGGGINGAGIARDAAGRGLRVALLERADFGGATSSASSKLIHGGLRYLEHLQFRLVAESLRERALLLRNAPHLVRPLRFVVPLAPGGRPAWLLRAGLWVYDRLGGRGALPGAQAIALAGTSEGKGLAPALKRGLSYWDAAVDDARLVLANVRDAAQLGADIHARAAFRHAQRTAGRWQVEIAAADGQVRTLQARALVNATGPWLEPTLEHIAHGPLRAHVRLVKGSHIVVRRIAPHPHAWLLQNADRRIVFVLPFGDGHSLIGTTDVPVVTPEAGAAVSAQEVAYLLDVANRHLAVPLCEADVVWRFSGVRALHDDGDRNPSAVTRDYALELDVADGAPLLSVYGGKLTTYRRLAERVLDGLRPWLRERRGPWTAAAPLPGGVGLEDPRAALQALQRRHAGLPPHLVEQLFHRHGTCVDAVLGDACSESALGIHFGAGLYEREVRYFIDAEWARTAEDVLWRRTKAGLHLDAAARAAFEAWFAAHGVQCA